MLNGVNWRCEIRTVSKNSAAIYLSKIEISRTFCPFRKIKIKQNTFGIENQFKEYVLPIFEWKKYPGKYCRRNLN